MEKTTKSIFFRKMEDRINERGSEVINVIFPDSVDLIITDECNMHCPVCWGSEMPRYKALPLERRLEMLGIPKQYGTTRFTITGGEPLLEDGLSQILRKGKELGMHQLLFTNCTLLRKKADDILPYIDAISLSLDGYDDKTNSRARKPGHFDYVLDSLELFKTTHPVKSVQVLTVVTKINKGYLEKIGELLREKSQGLNFRWKLNYHQPIGRESSRYHLPYPEFKLIAKDIKNKFSEMVVRYSLPQHDKGYLFLFPDGKKGN